MGGGIRNYLISTSFRNGLLRRRANRPDTTRYDLCREKLVYYHLECHRNGLLEHVLKTLPGYLARMSELERTEFVTFLYGYLFRDVNLPLWKKEDELTKNAQNVEATSRECLRELFQAARELDINEREVSDYARRSTEAMILENRARGKRIMDQMASCIGETSLGDILQELSLYLRTGQRTIDYNSILGLWDDEEPEAAD